MTKQFGQKTLSTIEVVEDFTDFAEKDPVYTTDTIRKKENNYILSPRQIVSLWLGIMHITPIQNMTGRQIRLYALKNRGLIELSIKDYLEEATKKGEVECE